MLPGVIGWLRRNSAKSMRRIASCAECIARTCRSADVSGCEATASTNDLRAHREAFAAIGLEPLGSYDVDEPPVRHLELAGVWVGQKRPVKARPQLREYLTYQVGVCVHHSCRVHPVFGYQTDDLVERYLLGLLITNDTTG